jgi:choline dehydrogenase-like flavoprotein
LLIDAKLAQPGIEFACDLCIVGAGPAGIAIADRLRDTGLAIILLESGGFHPELSTQRLYRGANVGRPYFRLESSRWRLFGGSTNRWGGMSRPLDPLDYERRDWLPWSGWPISWDTLEPYHADAAALLELTEPRFDLDVWRDRVAPPFELAGTNFENVVYQYSPETNFGSTHGVRLLDARNVKTFIHANLTGIELGPDSGRVDVLRVAALPGRTFRVRPKAVVLAAGGIENARLLLASHRDRPAGLGNEHDLVGRFFMEHLHVPAGHLLAAPGSSRAFYVKARRDGVLLRGAVAPTAAARDRHRLPSTSIGIEPASFSFSTPFCGWPPPVTFGPIRLYRALRGGRFAAVAEALKFDAERAGRARLKWLTWNAARAALARVGSLEDESRARPHPLYSLYFRAEQTPEPTSRVMLSERRDALGTPEMKLDWHVSESDIDAIPAWLNLFDKDLRSRGIGRVIAPAEGWDRGIIGGPHHMGTTRMSADPRTGVVDEHCGVHSVDNLYIAGSSVFTTGGYANPTFTLLALALRLADTLRSRLGADRAGVVAKPLV